MFNKFKHFYFNKYIVSRFSSYKYPISYDFRHKALWFRTTKVASRTIDSHLKKGSNIGEYIYSSPTGYDPKMYRDFFKFAFVRNPIDRFISAFRDKVLTHNYFKFEECQYERMKDLNHFIEWVEQHKMHRVDEHLQEQIVMIDTANVDFIGRFERFEEDFRIVSQRIGVDFDPDLHLNQSKRARAITISKENIQRIASIYRRDIRAFYPHEIDRIKVKKPRTRTKSSSNLSIRLSG